MAFSLLDLWDRVDEVRGRFRGAWTAATVGAVLIVGLIAFLVLESLWETMTSRGTEVTNGTDTTPPQAQR